MHFEAALMGLEFVRAPLRLSQWQVSVSSKPFQFLSRPGSQDTTIVSTFECTQSKLISDFHFLLSFVIPL
jgi:hypothetical protein